MSKKKKQKRLLLYIWNLSIPFNQLIFLKFTCFHVAISCMELKHFFFPDNIINIKKFKKLDKKKKKWVSKTEKINK